MDVTGKIVVITGAASGIGFALARALKDQGARVAISDVNEASLSQAAQELSVLGVPCDVRDEGQINALIDQTETALGTIDIFVSNAGIGFCDPSHAASASNQQWQDSFAIHVMSHVFAARRLLPAMIERGDGYLINTASAAGLLNQIGDAAYSTTKHAAVGLAESLAISHGDDGVKVSVVCPQYVATPMLGYDGDQGVPDHDGLLSPEQVADIIVQGIKNEQFLILPHPVVSEYVQAKASDYDRWIGGMRKLRRKSIAETGSTRADKMHLLV